MGKQRQKNRDQNEYHRGIIKELQKENRALKRQVANLEKYDRPKNEKVISEEKEISCPDCGKETITIFQILDKSYLICHTCGFRVKQ